MSVADDFEKIRGVAGTTAYAPLPRPRILEMLSSAGISLPTAHIELLELSDGLMVFGGYFRLFGVDEAKSINLISWNHLDTWKFAWDKKAGDFLCFGQNAWGDQYAYRLDDLKRKVEVPPVFMLDSPEFEKMMEWPCFEEFFADDIEGNSVTTYDSVTRAARQIHGDLVMTESLVYTPSLMIGGTADPKNAMKMPSATAMIANGDIWRQIANLPIPRTVVGVVPSPDDKGRMRMKILWAD